MTDNIRKVLAECYDIAVEWMLRGRIPECGKFGEIAQDLGAVLESWYPQLAKDAERDGCHCGTCTCNPNMTPAVRFDLSPARMEREIREHLIRLGWTPPDEHAQQLAAALEAAQMGLRYAVRVWVLSDEITWSKEEIDKAVESIINDAKKEAGND